jgi:hypothetical protein
MQMTFGQSTVFISAAAAAWAMVRAGTGKKLLVIKQPARCASCGRRRTKRACPCSGE